MQNVVVVNKPIGITPLQAIENIRQLHPEYKDQTLGYAGRLDPMAEGVMLILVGDENKKRKDYERLPKVYELSVLFGIATDSFDQMGIVTDVNFNMNGHIVTTAQKVMSGYLGKHVQPYPPYSAARVNGKPLYYWAREKKLDTIKIPQKEITIEHIEYLSSITHRVNDIVGTIKRTITNVQGEFRQKEILDTWDTINHKYNTQDVTSMTWRIACSSGTYIRSIANQLGQDLHIPTMALSIKRKSVGPYTLADAISITI